MGAAPTSRRSIATARCLSSRSSRRSADFRADRKWRDYAACCDRLYFAISERTPAGLMPLEAGLIVADPYGAEIVREAELQRMAPASRRALLLRFAQVAADRLHRLADPAGTAEFRSVLGRQVGSFCQNRAILRDHTVVLA